MGYVSPFIVFYTTNTWERAQAFTSSTTFSSSTLNIGGVVYFFPSTSAPTGDQVLHRLGGSSVTYWGGDGGGAGGGGGGGAGIQYYDGSAVSASISTFTFTGSWFASAFDGSFASFTFTIPYSVIHPSHVYAGAGSLPASTTTITAFFAVMNSTNITAVLAALTHASSGSIRILDLQVQK